MTISRKAGEAASVHRANAHVADVLREIADALEQQSANPFRVGAYRRAAATVEGLDEELGERFDRDGLEGLVALPGIGEGIGRTIIEILVTGRSSRLENLRGTLDASSLFRTVPGIGATLAERIHDALQVETLEALEIAAHDGRLEQVPGVGARRAAAIRAALASMLGRRATRPREIIDGPSLNMLLDVDRAYRELAAAGKLPTIAPRRFNPEGKSWLPVLHTDRGEWHFTALYSNTARAHELGRTGDWVVIYFYDDHHREAQHTVVTETRGPLVGQRVVRGREAECRTFYQDATGSERTARG
jgi:DNA polymerase (family 10)